MSQISKKSSTRALSVLGRAQYNDKKPKKRTVVTTVTPLRAYVMLNDRHKIMLFRMTLESLSSTLNQMLKLFDAMPNMDKYVTLSSQCTTNKNVYSIQMSMDLNRRDMVYIELDELVYLVIKYDKLKEYLEEKEG